ncbi:MAG: radical SAM protein [Atopobiaceae bacterium]|nr:radical SAM protein [Atopobiaceae bacterium]
MDRRRYIRIKPDYALRGWQGLPYALVRRDGGPPAFLTPDVFRTVRFCNGRFPADSPVFLGKRAEHVEELDRLGFLEYLDEPRNLLPEQRYRYHDNRYLRMVHWSLTGRCNYRCRHCYMSAPHGVLPQPTTEQCFAIADQIADCGVAHVSLTGGEPLVRSDFLAIVDRILEHGMHVDVIMTNGSLVDDELLDGLEARGCRPEFNMSFDGPRRWHDWLRGVDGAYDSVRRALALCHERGFVTGAELVLHRGNLHTLRESVRELGELGVASLKVNRLSCVGEGEALSDYAITAKEEYDAYVDYIPQYIEDGMPVPYLMLSGLFSASDGEFSVGSERHPEGEDSGKKVICAAARTTMYLGPDGRILPCIPMSQLEAASEVFPRIGEMTIAEALADSTYLSFITKTLGDYLRHNPECAGCAYRNRCGGGCRGQAVLENGASDLLGVDPDACLIFKGGYYERVKAMLPS